MPAKWGGKHLNAQYLIEPPDIFVPGDGPRQTMSCGLCGHLKRTLGAPPFIVDPEPGYDPGNEHLYAANWDFHPVGAWLAITEGHPITGDVDATVRHELSCCPAKTYLPGPSMIFP